MTTFLFKIALELRFLLNSRLRRAILATSYEPSSAEVRLWRLRVLEDSIVARGKFLSLPLLLQLADAEAVVTHGQIYVCRVNKTWSI